MNFENICRRLLEYAVLAPSIYNSQPWKFSVDASKGVIEVHPDTDRARPLELDPAQRDLHLALGACVENMVLAGPSMGYDIEVELFPKASAVNQPAPAVRCFLKPVVEVMPEPLFSALLIRHTHAGAYKPGTVADVHLQRLKALTPLSHQEKIHVMVEDLKRTELAGLLHDLSHEGAQKTAMVKEGARWIKPQSHVETGLPMAHIGLPISVKARFAFFRHLAYEKEIKEVARQTLLRQGHGVEAPGYLLLTTENSSPLGYVKAGRYLERIMLTLNEMELAFQTLHLPIALPFCHGDLRERFGAGPSEEPVSLLRFGQPENKHWARTHRRRLEESLQK